MSHRESSDVLFGLLHAAASRLGTTSIACAHQLAARAGGVEGVRRWHALVWLALGASCGREAAEVADAAVPVDIEEVPAVLRAHHAADFSFDGVWMRNTEPGYAYSFFQIQGLDKSRYEIAFLHATHSGCSKDSFEVSWSGASLRSTTDSGFPARLHPVRVEGFEGLVPDELLPSIEASMAAGLDWYDDAFWRSDEEELALQRRWCDALGYTK